MNSFALVDHLGWVLIHSLWQFAAIALVAGLVVWMLRRSTSTTRYAVWVIALGWAVTAPGVTWMVLPLEEPAVAAAIPQADDLAIFPVPAEPVAEAPPLPADVTLVGDVVPVNAVVSEPLQVAAVPITETISRPTWSETLTAILHPWMAWIVAGWCAGVGLCSLRPLLGWHTLWRLRTVGVAPVSDDIRTALRRVSDRLRLRQTVQVLQSTLSQVPVVVGYLRPVILLPVSLLTNMPPSQLEAILAHELAHIRRHDFIVNLLQTLVETLFFYHPAVWWLSRQIRVEREHCCDDLVVAALDNRVEYGRALLAIEELRGERTLLVLGAHDGSLLSRIRRIVGFHADRTASSPWMSLVFVTCLFSVIGLVSVLGWTASAENQPDTAIEIIDNDESDVKKTLEPPKPVIAEWSENRSIEFVSITKNTAPAKDGWLPSGLPMGDVPNWKSTIVLHGGNTSSSFTEGKPHPEPDADAIDFLFRFRGLKAQPSLTFDMPTRSSSYSHLPVQNPHELRVSAWRRPAQPPPGGKWTPPDGVVRVGLTDEPWGRYVKISPAGEVVDPIQPHELYASTYKLIDVQGTRPHDRISTGTAILIREPSAHIDPDNPDHRYVFEFRAIDTDGKEHWAIQWEGRGVERTQWVDSQYGLAQPLPARKTLSHYEYRLRPFRHWITFENVSIEPGPQTDVKFSVRSWPAVPSTLKVTNVDGSPATFNAVGVAQVGFPLKPMHRWLGWRDRNGVVSLEALPFGTHWILAAGDFEQRTIFSLAYPTGESRIERKLWAREPWTKHDLEFKTRFEPDEKTGGDIVVTIKNKFDKPLMLSEADFSLHVGELAMYRVMSPMWASGSFRIREIAGGQTGEVRLNWNDWVRRGFWATREGEGISEPTLPPNEPGRIYVRVCLGNSGALPIAVTDPAVMLAQKNDPIEVLRVGQSRTLISVKNVKEYRIDGKVIDIQVIDPRTMSITGVAAGLTVLTAINEGNEFFQQLIEVTAEAAPPNAEVKPIVFLPRDKRLKSRLTLKEPTLSIPVLIGVGHELEFPETIQSVEGFDIKTAVPRTYGDRILDIRGGAPGKTTITVKTMADEETGAVHVWQIEVQVEQPNPLQLRKLFPTDEPPKDGAANDPGVLLERQVPEQKSLSETKTDVKPDQQGSLEPTPANQVEIDQMVRENGITKLTLVYFQDQDRRTIPAVMLGHDLETHIVTSGLAGFGLDHIPAAVDRTFLVDAKGKSVDVEYHSGSRPGTFVYRALPGLVSANRKEPALLAVGDPVTAISIDAKGDFSGTLNAATVTALNTTAVINHRRLGERQYSGLIELNAPLLEGTLILKQGTLVGIVEVSTRFLGPESQKCYAVPFNSMQALSKELAAAKANADAAGERRRVALMKSVVTITRVEASTAEPKPKPNRRSGVVVDDRGYILAMYYPGDTPGDGFQIRLNDQSEHSAKVVATDQNLSVALLQISPRKPLKAISLDNLSTAKSGEPVTAIFADRWPSIMAGNVTGVGVELDINSTMIMKNLIETNVMINPGDGGSLLANADDQPLGVWHAIRVGKQRISFAIPLAEIVPFVSANLPVRQPAGAQDEPKEDPEKDERTSLLESLIQQPKLETFQKLLALADGKHPPPTELLDDSRRHSGKEKMGGEVRVISNGQERFAIVSAKVIPIIEPSDVAIRVDPERRAECAFVFDMQGRLIDTIGGKLAGGNSLGGDNIHVVNLGPEEDWFIRVMNFEKRGELNYRSDYYRIANPVVKSMRFYNLPNACSWSNGPEKIPRQGRLHPAHPQAQRPSYAGIPNAIPVTTAAGVPTVSAIVWDGDRNRFVAAPSAFVKGLPLYEVDTTWSREFEPLEPQVGQLAVEGGIREYDHWYAWEAAVPDQGNSVTVLTLPQRDGPAKVIEKKLAPGRHTVQLQAKPQDNGPGMQLKLWIDDDQKYDFDLPFAFGEAFANHPPIVNVLKPSESVRLVHRLLKDTTAALLFEIKLLRTSDAETSTTNTDRPRGTLKGRFVYDGDAPKPRDLNPELTKLDKDSEVPRDSKGRPIGTAMWYLDYLKAGIRPKTEDASLLVDKDGGIANIVVWVTSKEIPRTPKDNWLVPAMIYVKDGHFTPRIRLLTREQPLLVENADPVSFTFATSFQRNTNVNALLAPAADKKPFRINLAQVEPFPQPYRSNVATWANGYIFVRDNDYVTISQPDGTFTLPDLPPGEWEFRAWHERRGYLEHWPKGTFTQKIQPGDNDLGTIKLKPAFFEPREVNP